MDTCNYEEESTVASDSFASGSGATTSERAGNSEAMQGHHKHASDSSDDPIAILDTTALLTMSEHKGKAKQGGQNVVQHDRSFSHESIDPISLEAVPNSVSGLTSLMAVASLGDSTGEGGPATQVYPDSREGDALADGLLYVEADNDGEHIRFRLASGEKCKTRLESWEECITEEGTYFLYTSNSGWRVWTDDITGHHVKSGSKGKDKGRKGRHGGSKGKK
ncbi:hypothetical protein F503_07086 [Ophiostoma piceae UAMH 11346]|uniref:Uncharacterized protein n=1 Tax=Ophiostoma piceae (strain UAMH 11346) TaxID=1262450 RepID=S3D7D3_OPHP1|nr:hypothetical protein F503_07086 [Ophiostoma piceae UAMH 11346]